MQSSTYRVELKPVTHQMQPKEPQNPNPAQLLHGLAQLPHESIANEEG